MTPSSSTSIEFNPKSSMRGEDQQLIYYRKSNTNKVRYDSKESSKSRDTNHQSSSRLNCTNKGFLSFYRKFFRNILTNVLFRHKKDCKMSTPQQILVWESNNTGWWRPNGLSSLYNVATEHAWRPSPRDFCMQAGSERGKLGVIKSKPHLLRTKSGSRKHEN